MSAALAAEGWFLPIPIRIQDFFSKLFRAALQHGERFEQLIESRRQGAELLHISHLQACRATSPRFNLPCDTIVLRARNDVPLHQVVGVAIRPMRHDPLRHSIVNARQ
jgi:hypothetical protein